MVNLLGLQIELQAAAIQITGCNTDGVVWGPDGTEIQTRSDVAAIIAAHNKAVWDTRTANWLAKYKDAKFLAKGIPNYATWNFGNWAQWRDQHVSAAQVNPLSIPQNAKDLLNDICTALDGVVKMEIALRDRVMPDLADLAAGIITE